MLYSLLSTGVAHYQFIAFKHGYNICPWKIENADNYSIVSPISCASIHKNIYTRMDKTSCLWTKRLGYGESARVTTINTMLQVRLLLSIPLRATI